MLWEALQWFVGLVEVIAVVGAILFLGLVITMTSFWLLSRTLGKFPDPAEPDPSEWELDGNFAADIVPNGPSAASAPAEHLGR